LNKSLFARPLIGGILISTVIIGANVIAENKGAEIILIHGGKMRDIHFPHYRHQKALGDCNVCHDLFPARAGSIAEFKAQGKLKKKAGDGRSLYRLSQAKKICRKENRTNLLCQMSSKNRINRSGGPVI